MWEPGRNVNELVQLLPTAVTRLSGGLGLYVRKNVTETVMEPLLPLSATNVPLTPPLTQTVAGSIDVIATPLLVAATAPALGPTSAAVVIAATTSHESRRANLERRRTREVCIFVSPRVRRNASDR